VRYQQVYAAQDFTRTLTTPMSITEISFATLLGSQNIDVNLQNIEIRISTTQTGPDAQSPVFALNVGLDEATVYSGSLHFFDTGNEQYGLHILLQNPFAYNPTMGNLLLDVRNYATIAPPPSGAYGLAGALALGDSTSLVEAFNVATPNGALGTGGLITRFTVAPIPEPKVHCLGLLVAVAAWLLHRHLNSEERTN
jgi:hypothetical protein